MKTVILMQAVAKQYRRRFLECVRNNLADGGIEFHCLYGAPPKREAIKGDNIDLEWPLGKRIPSRWVASDRALIQPLPERPDLLVAELALKHLLQPWQRLQQRMHGRRFAYMGPGRPTQGSPASPTERIKRQLAMDADWWFPYTEGGRAHLEESGFPNARISTLWNSIDTADFRRAVESRTKEDKAAIRASHAIPPNAPVLLFCGSLYRGKRLDLVLEAYAHAKRLRPDLHLLVIGQGPDEELVKAVAATDQQCHHLGPRFDLDKAPAFAIADALLLPAYAGLAVVDGLVAGLPILTTDCPGHGAEFDYVQPGINAVISATSAVSLSEAIGSLLSDPDQLERLARGARETGSRFSAEAMADRFARGALECLRQPQRSR